MHHGSPLDGSRGRSPASSEREEALGGQQGAATSPTPDPRHNQFHLQLCRPDHQPQDVARFDAPTAMLRARRTPSLRGGDTL